MSMNIHAKKGDKVTYNGINGSEEDKVFASSRHLMQGEEYTVEKMYLSEFNTGVNLLEDPLCVFNSVMFDDVEQTLEQQVNECKEQTEDVAFIAIKDGRVLLKIDQQGFVTIGTKVVGHEPGVPKYFKQELINSEFNPELPFECSDDGVDWLSLKSEEYCFFDKKRDQHVLYDLKDEEYTTTKHIRNVKKPSLTKDETLKSAFECIKWMQDNGRHTDDNGDWFNIPANALNAIQDYLK
jgi:hypothetical protein